MAPIRGTKSRTMRWTEELPTARIVVDRYACVGTGPFKCSEIAIGQVNQQTPIPVGWIGKAHRAIGRHAGITDDLACMGRRRWGWSRRLRWLRSRR